MQLTLKHDLAIGEALFWQWFVDAEFNRKMYLEHLRFPRFELVSLERRPDGTWQRHLRAQPNVALPAPLRGLLGGSTGYEEHAEIDCAGRRFRARFVPAAAPERVRAEARIWTVAHAPDAIARHVQLEVEVSAPLFARMLERFILDRTAETFEASAVYIARRGAELQS